MLNWRVAKLIIGKVGYGGACLLSAVLVVVAGYAHKEVGYTQALGKGIKIANSAPVGAAMNILVMGLESRTDYQGDVLSNDLLAALHAGKQGGDIGAQDTNTLILIHVFAGGQKAVGYSIPRDSLVSFPQAYDGFSEGKIDAAYNWAYTEYLNDNTGKESKSDLYLQANQAGQTATIDTVESVTGVHVDHFVEVNLEGFYYLAKAFGGVEVCIRPAPAQDGFPAGANLTDIDNLVDPPTDNSGFNAYKDGYNQKKGGAQYLHLSAAQSLAFVRSRDTLPGVDVGRTYRQQAFLDYVVWKVKHEGTLTDLDVINNVLSGASQYLITDSGLDVLDFASDVHALSSQNLHFTTLPGTAVNDVNIPDSGYGGAPQDVYEISVPQIQQLVQSAFAGQASLPKGAIKSGGKKAAATPAASTVTVDVYNGNPGANGLAGLVSQALSTLGYKPGAVENSARQSQIVQPGTQVFYGTGASANATKIATQFGTTAVALKSLPADHVEVLTGSTVTTVPAGLTPASSTSATPSAGTQSVGAQLAGGKTTAPSDPVTAPTPSASATAAGGGSTANDGESSDVASGAKYGIPCVY